MRPILLLALALLFADCLPDAKRACRTTEDCISGRTCVAGVCQSGTASDVLEASVDASEGSTDIQHPPDAGDMRIDAGCDQVKCLPSAWEIIGGTPVSGPGVTHWGPGQNHGVFWRGTDNHLKHKWFPEDSAWPEEEDLGGTLISDPAACSRASGVVDVFWRGTDDRLKHTWNPWSEGWSWVQDLGGTLVSAPAAASWDPWRLFVFWRGADGNLKQRTLDYATDDWTAEVDLGIPVQSDPAAFYRTIGVMDVFWRGASGTLKHVWSVDGANWSWVQDLGRAMAADSSPTVASRQVGWVDVFLRGIDDHLQHIWMTPSNEWTLIGEDLGGDLAGSPSATSGGAGRLDVFAKDASTGHLAHLVWNREAAITVNDTDSGIRYSEGWIHSPGRGLLDYLDDVYYATTDGSYFEYTFHGTGVDFVTETEASQGDVDVYIDDVFQQTVSCYSPTRFLQQVVYSKKGLPPGAHTIKVSKVNATFILLDALRIHP